MTDIENTGASQEPGSNVGSTHSVLAGRITPPQYPVELDQAGISAPLGHESRPQSLVDRVGTDLVVDTPALEGEFKGVKVAHLKTQEELDREAFERDWAIHARGIEHE